MDNLLDDLNEQQKKAVIYNDGPSLIIAGAGSGKTRVLTYKIAHFIQQGIAPYHILSLTFTNKAAREMKERISRLVGERMSRYLWMGTFHSVFARILRVEAEKIGYTSNYTIMDASDSKNLVKTIIKELQLDDKVYRPGYMQNIISSAKNALISPRMYVRNKDLTAHDQRARIPLAGEIYTQYNNRLRASNAMDFDDLLFYTNNLFRDYPDVLAEYQQKFQFILVDEYQDTNFAQYLVIKLLSDAHRRVCVVGDDAQSIYSFRGANIDNILKFKEIYPEAKIFKLEQNYRSTQNIVNAANSLIKQNREQIQKNVFSTNNEGDKIEVVSAYSDFEEGIIVANKILDIRRVKNASFSDFVILYRTNAQSRVFEESLRKKNIPYRIYGGLSFYQRKEIKDVIAYFRLVVNPNDEEAFKRIINFPVRGIGLTTLSKVIGAAKLHSVSLWDVISAPLEYNLGVNSGTTKKLVGFRELIDTFITKQSSLNAYDLATLIIKQSGIAHDAYQDMTPEGMSRQENLQELLGGIHEFCETRREEGEENIRLIDFLSEVSLLTDQDTDKSADAEKVTMMTVHASKGLEFNNVFIVGLEEDLFPSSMAKNEMRGLEEERRLFYVAITRSKEFCMLTYAKSRFRNGQVNMCNPSRFFKDIDSRFLNVTGNLPYANGGATSRTNDVGGQHSYYKKKEEDTAHTSQSQVDVGKANLVNSRFAKPKAGAVGEQGVMTVKAGNKIKHERFGIGIVISVEGDLNNRKATVAFENAGTKQLLLKFARFEVIN